MTKILIIISFLSSVFISASSLAQAPWLVYHDADYSNHSQSAIAIKMGFLTALDEQANTLQGRPVVLVEKDHRGNSVRSKLHFKQFIKDPNALFVLGGLHSPPYIKYRDYINQNQVPLLVPWAAGGPITRWDKGGNSVFRLSIDDTKAGYRMVQFALDGLNCKQPALLLEDTPWGKSNVKTMTAALKANKKTEPKVTWFNWNTKQNSARIILRDIKASDADCILFVGNAIEGSHFFQAMASLDKSDRLPIVSHWGITGGDFHQQVDAKMRANLSLHFIQTCFSFISSPSTELSESVINRAKKLFPEQIQSASDIPAPAGFIHAYDLTKLALQALNQVELSDDIKANRQAFRTALESPKLSVQGLIKHYQPAFRPWQNNQDDAHEALGLADFCMAQYDENDKIQVLAN